MQIIESNAGKWFSQVKISVYVEGFPSLFPWPKHSLHTHTYTQQETKKHEYKERERERKREVFIKWPFWILSKGLVSHYGDLEKSPCSLIPLLLLWSKGIQWKFHSPKWEPILTLLILLTTARKAASSNVLKKNYKRKENSSWYITQTWQKGIGSPSMDLQSFFLTFRFTPFLHSPGHNKHNKPQHSLY